MEHFKHTTKSQQLLPNLPKHHDHHSQRQSMSHSRLGDTRCSHIANDRRTAHKHKQASPEHLSQAGLHVLLKDASLLVGVVSPVRLLSHLCYCEDLSLVFSLWHAESQLLPRCLVQLTDHSLKLGAVCVHLCI